MSREIAQPRLVVNLAPSAGEFERALLTLANDAACIQAVRHLEAAAVPVVALKGAAIASWLYSGAEERPYSDIDLLVPPNFWDTALHILGSLGYRAPRAEASRVERSTSELDLIGPSNLRIDLHHRLAGSAAEPSDRCARVLLRHTVRLPLGGTTVPVLDEPARAMHLALHAAQNGPFNGKSHEDLRRGLAQLSRETWAEARLIADAIGAGVAFAVGLRTHAEGRALARDLDLPELTNVELTLRQQGAPPQSLALAALSELEGTARARMIWRKLIPTTALLHDRYALPNRSLRTIVRAYGRHWRHVVSVTVPAVRAYRRASRQIEGRGSLPPSKSSPDDS